jgi:hypothetical protein
MPAINEMIIKVNENFAIATKKRLSLMNQSPEERYAELMKSYPEFIHRFPQHIIASYLGVSRETLSRARNHPVKK